MGGGGLSFQVDLGKMDDTYGNGWKLYWRGELWMSLTMFPHIFNILSMHFRVPMKTVVTLRDLIPMVFPMADPQKPQLHS